MNPHHHQRSNTHRSGSSSGGGGGGGDRHDAHSSTGSKKHITVGVYFGSFDPLHLNHIAIAEHAIKHFGVDRVYFVPNCDNPFKPYASSLELRERLIAAHLAAINDGSQPARFELYRAQGDERWDWAGRAFICKRIRTQLSEYAVRVFQLIGQDSFEAPTAQRALANTNVRSKLSRTLLIFPRDGSDHEVNIAESLLSCTAVASTYRDPITCSSTMVRAELYATGTSASIHPAVATAIAELGMYAPVTHHPHKTVVLLLGGPASGKGSLAQRLCDCLGAVHFSGGEFYRLAMADDEFRREDERAERNEALEPRNRANDARFAMLQNFVVRCLQEFVRRSNQTRFVIDGITYPLLAESAFNGHSPDLIIQLECDPEILLARALARARDSVEVETRRIAQYAKNKIYTAKNIEGYLAHGRSTRIITIDSSSPIDEYLEQHKLLDTISQVIASKKPLPTSASPSPSSTPSTTTTEPTSSTSTDSSSPPTVAFGDEFNRQIMSIVLAELRPTWASASSSAHSRTSDFPIVDSA